MPNFVEMALFLLTEYRDWKSKIIERKKKEEKPIKNSKKKYLRTTDFSRFFPYLCNRLCAMCTRTISIQNKYI